MISNRIKIKIKKREFHRKCVSVPILLNTAKSTNYRSKYEIGCRESMPKSNRTS